MLKAAPTIFAAALAAAAITVPLSASAATGGARAASLKAATAKPFRIFQKINGFKVCLDSQFEFSVCQTGPSPDDPPSVQKWTLISGAHGAVQIDNGGQCLDVTSFTAPCSQGGSSQLWLRVSAGNGTVKVENKSSSGTTQCLDSMWTFHPCSRGDKQQIWTFAHKV
jgi:hypothetical protein